MCSAGQSMNRWSLEEMVKRDPDNFLILLQQIIRKTKEVRPQRSKWIRCPLDVLWGNGSLLSMCLRVFRFRSSVSTSWWLPSRSCSPPRCSRYDHLKTSVSSQCCLPSDQPTCCVQPMFCEVLSWYSWGQKTLLKSYYTKSRNAHFTVVIFV